MLLFFAGAALGYFGNDLLKNSSNDFVEKREGSYRFINPLLECDAAGKTMKRKELVPFEHKVNEVVSQSIQQGKAQAVTVYFRELNDGIWFSIGETERFVPASLRKVPLMISLLKQAEADPAFLSKQIKNNLSKDHTAQQSFRPAESIKPGGSYTVDELIYRMIVYSDNNAFALLTSIVDAAELRKTYTKLSIGRPSIPLQDDYLSVMTYASFFRILYNATYLNREYSERALEYLSNAYFDRAIVAGVPRNITVAHKFGEHIDIPGGSKQLHDCGIVYFPNHPYLVCIMSRGTDFNALSETMRAVSGVIYENMAQQHAGH
ncbi:MAG: hypothetical protein OHK006_17200 [Thermodesulfovibrionales bacterium]